MFSSAATMFSFASIFSLNANDDGRGYVLQSISHHSGIKVLTSLIVATTKNPTQQLPSTAGQWIFLSSHLVFPKPALDLPPLASALAAAFTTFLLLQIFTQHSMA